MGRNLSYTPLALCIFIQIETKIIVFISRYVCIYCITLYCMYCVLYLFVQVKYEVIFQKINYNTIMYFY